MTKNQETPSPGHKLNFRNWRISTKLLVVMLTLTLIPVVIVTVIGVRTGGDALTHEQKVNHARLANSTAQRIEQLLSGNQSFISVTSRQPSVISFLAAETERVAADFEPEVYAAIDRLLESNSTIDLASLFDANGTVVAHNRPEFIGQPYLFRDFVKAALIDQVAYTSGIQVGWTTNQPGINASAPVKTAEGLLVGAMSTRIRGDYIEEMLRSEFEVENDEISATERNAMEIYLINEYAIVMSHSHESHADSEFNWLYYSLGTVSEEDLAEITALRLLGGECEDGADTCAEKVARTPKPIPALQAMGDTLLTAMETSTVGSYRYCRPTDTNTPDTPAATGCANGKWHIIGFAPVSNPDPEAENLFMVVVDVPEDIFLQPIGQLRNQGIIVGIIVTLIVLLVALILAQMLAKPIGELAGVAQDVEEDRPFEPASIADVMSQGDEVGHLARVFSAMVLALRARMAELRTIFEIGQEISAGVGFEETLMYILSAIHDVIPYDMAELGFYEAKEKRMVVRAAADFECEEGEDAITYYEPETAGFYDVNEGILARLVEKRSALLIADVQEDEDLEVGAERKWGGKLAKSYLGVVLKSKGKVIGAIELVSGQPNKFNEDNSRLLTSIAVQAAIEVHNAQEVQEREQRLAQQIQQMDIVIDKDKQSEQINNIMGSAFFKTARDKAKDARKGPQK